MAYRYRSRRSAKRLVRQSRRNFIITLILVAALIYATIQWILPNLIGGLGLINSIIKPSKKVTTEEGISLAPPVLNIPYEATNTAQINILGYATPLIKVSIFVDDQLKGSTEALEDGSFEVKGISLALGTNNIYGKTIEEEKESLLSKSIKVIYDDEKPLLEISEPEDGKTIQGERKLQIRGKTEPNAQVFVNDSRVITSQDGTFTSEFQLSDGDNNLTIKAVDLASNQEEVVRKVIFKP